MAEVEVVGVRFKRTKKVYYFSPEGLPLKRGDEVIVETSEGLMYGEVVTGPKRVPEAEIIEPLKRVLRKALPRDEKRLEENKDKEREAFQICLEKIAAHGLEMKLVDVEYNFDGSKITFYFTADGRVDFRELVKDLAATFRTRIELRQIGVRDEARMLGGIGCCGRPLCCTSFLGSFDPVSIRMAKDQNLPLNPGKISGVCGRLMCCLRYENEVYEEAKVAYPHCGDLVITPTGKGKVIGCNILKEEVTVEFPERQTENFPLAEISTFTADAKEAS